MTVVVAKLLTDDLISINVPLARYDVTQLQAACIASISTHIPLARYDQIPTDQIVKNLMISIHIPLARYDASLIILSSSFNYFNPHTARAV